MKDVFTIWVVLCNILVVLQPMAPFVRHGDVDSLGLFGEMVTK